MAEKNCPTYISPDIFFKASKYKIKDYAKIFGMFDSKEFKINAVKKSLSQNNPVIIGMNTPSFLQSKRRMATKRKQQSCLRWACNVCNRLRRQ
jgi:hypothetical protein